MTTHQSYPTNFVSSKLLKEVDVNITAGSPPDIKLFVANKSVLDNYPVCSKLNSNQDGGRLSIVLPDVPPKIFEVILNYMYTGNLDLGKLKTSDITEMLRALEEFSDQKSVEYFQNFLIKNKSNWLEKHFNLIYQTSLEYDRFELRRFCEEFIDKSPELIFQSPDFIRTPESLLISLLKKDDLLLDEVIVWDNVLKWGLSRNPDISPNPHVWSDDDILSINDTLKECLPLIRFSQLTSQQFYERAHHCIFRLQPLFHEKLLKYYLVGPDSEILSPPRLIEVNGSKIIDNHHTFSTIFSYISKLINNEMIYRDLDYSQRVHYFPFELKLLLRGSRHGFSPKIFHELCDNKPGTVTIIKVKDEDEILGGYNPGTWLSKNGYGECKSFIFSLKNNYENITISHVDYDERALNYGTHYGPSFGLSDLIISGENFKYGGRCYCKMDDYKQHIRHTENMFSVEDYEVFQIIKKN